MSSEEDPLLRDIKDAPEQLPDDIRDMDADYQAKRNRTSQFDYLAERYAREYGADIPDMARHVKAMMMRESGGDIHANSGKANGLMQVAPGTFQDEGGNPEMIDDPEENVRIGTKYLAAQLRKYRDPKKAYAAYNAGPSAVDQYGGVPPFHETINHGRAVAGYFKRLPSDDPLLDNVPDAQASAAEAPSTGAPAQGQPHDALLDGIDDPLLDNIPDKTPTAATPPPSDAHIGAPLTASGSAPSNVPSLSGYRPPGLLPGLNTPGPLTRGGAPTPLAQDVQGAEQPPPTEQWNPSPLLSNQMLKKGEGAKNSLQPAQASLQPKTPEEARRRAQAALQANAEVQPASNEEFGGGFVKGAANTLTGGIAHLPITAKEEPGSKLGQMAAGAAPALLGPAGIPIMAGQALLNTAKPEPGTGEITNPVETGTQMLTQSAMGAIPGLPGNGLGAKVLSGAGIGGAGAVANEVVNQLIKNGHLDPNDPEALKNTTIKVLMGLGDPEAVKQYILQASLGVGFVAGGHEGEAQGEYRHPNEGAPAGMAGPEAEIAKGLPNISGNPEPQQNIVGKIDIPGNNDAAPASGQDLVTQLVKGGLSQADAEALAEHQASFMEPGQKSSQDEASLQNDLEKGMDVPDEALTNFPHLQALKEFLKQGAAANEQAQGTPEGDKEVPAETLQGLDPHLDKMEALSLKKEFSSSGSADKNISLSVGTGSPVPAVENRTGLPGNAETPTGTPPTLQNETREAANTEGRLRTGTPSKVSPIVPEVNAKRPYIHIGDFVARQLAHLNMGKRTASLEVNIADIDRLGLRNADGTDKTKGEMREIMGAPVKISRTAPKLSEVAHLLNEFLNGHEGEPLQIIGQDAPGENGYHEDDLAEALINRPRNKAALKAEIEKARANSGGTVQEQYERTSGHLPQEEMAARNKEALAGMDKGEPAPAAQGDEGPLPFNVEPKQEGNGLTPEENKWMHDQARGLGDEPGAAEKFEKLYNKREAYLDEVFKRTDRSASEGDVRDANPPQTPPITGEQARPEEDAPPSRIYAAKAMRRVAREVNAGRMTPDEGVQELRRVSERIDNHRDIRNAEKESQDRARGADFIEEKLLGARRRGEISDEYYHMTSWFVKENPHLAADLGISLRGNTGRGVGGYYDPYERVIHLMKNARNPETGIHEILHHVERMMPDPVRAGIFKEYIRRYADEFKGADFQKLKALELIGRAASGDSRAHAEMIEAFTEGKIPYALYQYSNPSEFWAVNGARIMGARANETWVGRAKRWMKGFVDQAKSVFGMASDHPIVRGLENVMNGTGERVSRSQLATDPRYHLQREALKERYMNPEKPKASQEDMFGNKGRTASQGLIKGKGQDKGLEGTPLFGTADAEETSRAQEDQQKLFDIDQNTPEDDKRAEQVLSASVVPGLKEFIEQDIAPTSSGILNGFKDVLSDITHLLAPRVGVPEKAMTSIYKMKGEQQKLQFVYEQTMRSIKKMFNKMGEGESVAFVDRLMRGEAQPTPKLQAIAESYRKILDGSYSTAKVYKHDLPYKKDYFPIRWKKPPSWSDLDLKAHQEDMLKQTAKSLQGRRNFMKRKVFQDLSTGIQLGGIPESTNPQSLFELGMSEALKYVSAQRMWDSLKNQGFAEFVPVGKDAPKDYVRLKDSIGRQYYPNPEKGGVTLAGDYYVEPSVARVIHNTLSEDKVRATSYGRGLLAVKNLTTAMELSLSPFHFMFESTDAMASKFGLGLTKIANEGKVVEGLKDMLLAWKAPLDLAKTGGRAIQFVRNREEFLKTVGGQDFVKQFPDAGRLLDDLFTGGGKLAIHEDYKINTVDTFLQNINSNNYIGATLRALQAANEMLMKPLFEVYIPRLKVGLFYHEMSQQLSQHAKGLADGTVSRAKLARDTWDRVENRFGEMNFDNLFWDRTFKSTMQLLFRSVTWKLGTVRGGGSAILGQAREFGEALKLIKDRQGNRSFKKPKLDPGMAWVMGLMATTATLSTIAQLSLTGKPPSELKDFVFPRTGGKDANGNDNRLSIPTYIRDALHLARSPVGYVAGSMSGLFSRTLESLQNRDFYGDFVYDPEAPAYKKLLDGLANVVPKPFSVTQFQNLGKGASSPAEKTLAMLGFGKAPKEYIQTEFQQKLAEAFERQVGFKPKTPEQKAMKLEKKDFTKKLAAGTFTAAELGVALKDKLINPKTIAQQVQKARLSPMQYMWKLLGKDDKANLEQYMNDSERKLLWVPKMPKGLAAPVPQAAVSDSTSS